MLKLNIQYIQLKVKRTLHEKFFSNIPAVSVYKIKHSLHVNNLVKMLQKDDGRKELVLFEILFNGFFFKPLITKMGRRILFHVLQSQVV